MRTSSSSMIEKWNCISHSHFGMSGAVHTPGVLPGAAKCNRAFSLVGGFVAGWWLSGGRGGSASFHIMFPFRSLMLCWLGNGTIHLIPNSVSRNQVCVDNEEYFFSIPFPLTWIQRTFGIMFRVRTHLKLCRQLRSGWRRKGAPLHVLYSQQLKGVATGNYCVLNSEHRQQQQWMAQHSAEPVRHPYTFHATKACP